jgi:hypothetical protein
MCDLSLSSVQRNEQDRASLLSKERELPALLIQAVDRIPSGWTALSAQLELFRIGDPEVTRELAATRRAPRTGLNPNRVEVTLEGHH